MSGRPRPVLPGVVAATLVALAAPPISSAAAPTAGYPSTAAGARASEWWLHDLGVEQAWQQTKGAGVTIAVIDSGVDPGVAELKGALVPGADFSRHGHSDGEAPVPGVAPDFAMGRPDDGSHGTLVAAAAAGRGNGAGGTLGVAPEAKIMPISLLIDGRLGPKPAWEGRQCDQALHYAVDHGARVVNVSLLVPCGGDGIEYAEAHDVIVVASAGNDGADEAPAPSGGKHPLLDTPARLAGVVAVSGVNRDLSFAKNSSWGGAKYDYGDAFDGGGVALAGPFEVSETTAMVISTIDGRYEQARGTSIAAPIVAGMAALIRAKYPKMPAADVITRLLATAKVPGGAALPDPHYGFGVPNVERALTTDTPHMTKNPLGTKTSPGSAVDPPDDPGVWGPDGLDVFRAPKGTPGSAEYALGRAGGSGSATPDRPGPPTSPDGSRPASASGGDSRKTAGGVLLLAAALVAGLAAWVFWRRGRPDPRAWR